MSTVSSISSQSTTAQNSPTCYDFLSKTVSSAVCGAGIGALTGVVFSVINPLGGAIYGASHSIISAGLSFALDKLGWTMDSKNLCLNIARWAVPFFVSIGAAALITSAVGFPLTFTVGLILTGAMMATTCLVTTICAGTCLCGVLAAQVAGEIGSMVGATQTRA